MDEAVVVVAINDAEVDGDVGGDEIWCLWVEDTDRETTRDGGSECK